MNRFDEDRGFAEDRGEWGGDRPGPMQEHWHVAVAGCVFQNCTWRPFAWMQVADGTELRLIGGGNPDLSLREVAADAPETRKAYGGNPGENPGLYRHNRGV